MSAAQIRALSTVFDQFLQWPPAETPVARTLDYAARRLALSPTRVQQLLGPARERARTLGWTGGPSLMQPGYLHTLVRHGLVPAPTSQVAADPLG